MTIQLERLNDNSFTDRNFALLQLVLDRIVETGGTRGTGVRFGAFSGTTAASGEVVIPITHGLGKTPVAAFMTSDSAASVQVTVRAVSPTSTTIGAYVVRSTAAAVSVGGYWMVIG